MHDKEIQKLLNDLLYCITESFVDVGFGGDIYHYSFNKRATELVKEFAAKIKEKT